MTLRNAQYLITETDPMRLIASTSDVAFVGRSNVGKSSLICAICENKKLARVSKIPGRTRAVNIFEVARGRWIIDLPGYGYAVAEEKLKDYWPKMIGLTLSSRPHMACVFVLLDAEREVTPIDRSMMAWLRENNIPFRVVGTKVDALPGSRQRESRTKMAQSVGFLPEEIFWVSAKKGYGLKEMRQEISRLLKV